MPPCESLCAADPVCVVAVYSLEDGNCYLKSTAGQPSYQGRVHALKFTSTTTTAPAKGCSTAAPDSPFLLNGGFERGLLGVDQQSNTYGGPSTSGGFSVSSSGGVQFEGCNAM